MLIEEDDRQMTEEELAEQYRLDRIGHIQARREARAQKYLYFIQAKDGTGPIKIGRSSSPKCRFRDIQSYSPVPLVMLFWCEVKPKTESGLHRRFAKSRLHGEWFKPTQELLDLIAQVKLEGADALYR